MVRYDSFNYQCLCHGTYTALEAVDDRIRPTEVDVVYCSHNTITYKSIHSFISNIFIPPLQGNYSEALALPMVTTSSEDSTILQWGLTDT